MCIDYYSSKANVLEATMRLGVQLEIIAHTKIRSALAACVIILYAVERNDCSPNYCKLQNVIFYPLDNVISPPLSMKSWQRGLRERLAAEMKMIMVVYEESISPLQLLSSLYLICCGRSWNLKWKNWHFGGSQTVTMLPMMLPVCNKNTPHAFT